MFGNCTVKKNNQQDDSHENHTTSRNRDGDNRLVAQTTGNCSSQQYGGWCHVDSSVKKISLALSFHCHHLEIEVRLMLEVDFACEADGRVRSGMM
jgi:hypothetical protein